MKKIINPCTVDGLQAFAEINFNNGKLSIHGVIAPMRNGDCKGSCGQCVDEIRRGKPSKDWTADMLEKFCDIWDEYHLNVRPYCEHQKSLGWDKLESKEVTLYHWRMTQEAIKEQKAAEKAALTALRCGETFKPTIKQRFFAGLLYSLTTHTEVLSKDVAKYYEPKKPLWIGDTGHTETKALGWLRETEHPDGILSKACPVYGYKYGTAWKTEEVPQEIIDWLFSLPTTKRTPAWI